MICPLSSGLETTLPGIGCAPSGREGEVVEGSRGGSLLRPLLVPPLEPGKLPFFLREHSLVTTPGGSPCQVLPPVLEESDRRTPFGSSPVEFH